MATWHKVLAAGFVGATLTMACTITTVEDDDDDFTTDAGDDFDDDDSGGGTARGGGGAGGSRAGSAGTATFGGTGGTGGSTPGTGGGGAGGSTAGSGGTSGSGGTNPFPSDLRCDAELGTDVPNTCEFEGAPPGYESCLSCLSANCCEEVKNCHAQNPSDVCAYGGDGETSEYMCYMACLSDILREEMVFTDDDAMECAFQCGTPFDGNGMACSTQLIGDRTNELLSCMHANCEIECIDEVAFPPETE